MNSIYIFNTEYYSTQPIIKTRDYAINHLANGKKIMLTLYLYLNTKVNGTLREGAHTLIFNSWA